MLFPFMPGLLPTSGAEISLFHSSRPLATSHGMVVYIYIFFAQSFGAFSEGSAERP